jgi:hypothetical protein
MFRDMEELMTRVPFYHPLLIYREVTAADAATCCTYKLNVKTLHAMHIKISFSTRAARALCRCAVNACTVRDVHAGAAWAHKPLELKH